MRGYPYSSSLGDVIERLALGEWDGALALTVEVACLCYDQWPFVAGL